MRKPKCSPKRFLILALLAFAVAVAMLSAPSTSSAPVQVQAQDLTLAWLNAQATIRQGEIIATAQEQRRQVLAATAQRQQELNALHDTQTRTALEITQSAATALYWGGQTQTPIAQTAIAGQATATWQVQATATGYADATGTTQATQTQVAGTAQATQTRIAATRTATAELAQARQTATMAAILQKGEQDRIAAENRQRLMSQARQAVYILSGFILLAMGAALVVLVWRMILRPKPVQVVEIVKEPEERPLTPKEIAEIEVPPPIVVNDETLAQQIFENLRASGAL